jgi:hypothetical protein
VGALMRMMARVSPETAMPIPRRATTDASVRLLPWVLLALLLLAAAPAVWAESVMGNGKIVSEVRNTGEFTAIGLGSNMGLRLRQGSSPSVVLHGDSNLLPLIETVVERESLQLRWKRGVSVRSPTSVYVEVTAPQVRAVANAGSGDIEIDTMKVPRLSLSINGSGQLRARGLGTDDLSIGVSGSGDLKLAGQATRLTIDLSGSGDVDAGELHSDDVTVGIAGSGDVVVQASRRLAASIAGSGTVRYSGDASVQQSIAGPGSVRRR